MRFDRNRPVETTEGRVAVDAPRRPGRYVFQLVVEDRRGRRSAPAQLIVDVVTTT